jgi:sulfur-carrier protein adenylyltransferase/sulfurtransferase
MLKFLEKIRYARHLSIPEFGEKNQDKLKSAKILVVGAGGLGSPALLYLAAAGIGKIGIIDFDRVELSNLQRQVLFDEKDIDQLKSEIAARKLNNLNSDIEIEYYSDKIKLDNVYSFIDSYDLILDGSDNFETRYLLNDACVIRGKTLIHGSIYRFEGHVSVFNHLREDGLRGPNYRDLFPVPPDPAAVPNCSESGVLGVLPGLIGTIMVAEVIKIITGIGEILDGKLLIFNLLDMKSRVFKLNKQSDVLIKELTESNISYCSNESQINMNVQSITVEELKSMMESKQPFQLIDVRESFEKEIADIGGTLIPLSEILEKSNEIATEGKVIFYCRSGRRSEDAIKLLGKNEDTSRFYNLIGGILEWSDKIDSSKQKY